MAMAGNLTNFPGSFRILKRGYISYFSAKVLCIYIYILFHKKCQKIEIKTYFIISTDKSRLVSHTWRVK